MSANDIYNNPAINKMREEVFEGYQNYGRVTPGEDLEGMTLKKANDNMLDYLVTKLDINQESHVLEIGCGKGMYVNQIAQRTGCKFIGTDLSKDYLDRARKMADEMGVSEKGSFCCAALGEMPAEVTENKFTHILAMGILFYGNPILDKIFLEIAACSDSSTKIFVWDYSRVAEWSECATMNRHLKLPHPLLTKEEFLEKVSESPLEVVAVEDATKYVIPGYNIMAGECKRRDPEMKVLTNPLCRDAFVEGKIAYMYYDLKLQ